jgi:hypothetical protein
VGDRARCIGSRFRLFCSSVAKSAQCHGIALLLAKLILQAGLVMTTAALLVEVVTAPPRSRAPPGRNKRAKTVPQQKTGNEDRSVSANRIDPDGTEQVSDPRVIIFSHIRAISEERTRSYRPNSSLSDKERRHLAGYNSSESVTASSTQTMAHVGRAPW